MKPRFRAELVVVREELLILASCLLRPMSRNSVLEEFFYRAVGKMRNAEGKMRNGNCGKMVWDGG